MISVSLSETYGNISYCVNGNGNVNGFATEITENGNGKRRIRCLRRTANGKRQTARSQRTANSNGNGQ